MIIHDITGPQLFLRYAFPCADSRRLAGHITQEHFDRFKELIEYNEQPPRRLLKFCFPNAFKALRQFASLRNRQADLWDLAIVAHYWRSAHGHSGDCRVIRGKITTIQKNTVTIETAENTTMRIINLYTLPVSTGSFVYQHRRVLVEIE